MTNLNLNVTWWPGRPQTFFQGRAKFSRGAKTYYLPKKHLKRYYFPQKSAKNILFWSARGHGPPLALPCGRPCMVVKSSKLGPKHII